MGRLYDGTCRLCGDIYTGTGISSHVKRCLTDHADIAAIHHGLLVGARSSGPAGRFWMYLLVRPEAPLSELDAFLRDVWFEDDDTASGFDIEETQYLSRLPDDDGDDELPIESMGVDLGAVIRPRMEFSYTFDPRAPTSVEFTVFDPYPCPETLVEGGETGAATLVARNDIDGAECATCESPAVFLCLDCLAAEEEAPDGDAPAEDGDEASDEPDGADAESDSENDEGEEIGPLVCEDCTDRHGGELVRFENSPRSGVVLEPEAESEE